MDDMARSQLQEVVIIKWLSLKSTIEYLGEGEALYNADFNYTEFGTIRNASGSNKTIRQLNQIAITQMTSLVNNLNLKNSNKWIYVLVV
jgi:hypothetical protein